MTAAPAKKIETLTGLYSQADRLKSQIDKLNLKLSPLKDELKEVEQRILDSLVTAGAEAVRTKLGTYSVRRATVPHVDDWEKVDAFILKTKSLDLLHRRLTATAWAARRDSGILVPGTSAATVTTLAWRAA